MFSLDVVQNARSIGLSRTESLPEMAVFILIGKNSLHMKGRSPKSLMSVPDTVRRLLRCSMSSDFSTRRVSHVHVVSPLPHDVFYLFALWKVLLDAGDLRCVCTLVCNFIIKRCI